MSEEYRLYAPPNEKALDILRWIRRKPANPLKPPFEMCIDREHVLFEIFLDFLQRHNGYFTARSWRHYYWVGTREPVIIFRSLKRRFIHASNPTN